MLYDNLHSFRVAFCCGYSTSIKFWRITIPVTGGRLWDKTGKIYFLPRSGTGTFYPSESPRCRLHRGSVTGTYQRNAHPHFQSSKAAAQRYQSVDWYSKLYQGAGKQRLWAMGENPNLKQAAKTLNFLTEHKIESTPIWPPKFRKSRLQANRQRTAKGSRKTACWYGGAD